MKRPTIRTVIISLVCTSLIFACTNPNSQSGSASGPGTETQWDSLFNGKNLQGWYAYQKAPEPTSEVPGLARDEDGSYKEAIGLYKDPLRVFTVVSEDNAAAIRISGEVFGILVTEKEYENYHLSLQFKWGTAKYPPRKNEKRDSGILYHSIGSEGAWYDVWMRSLECQVQEGDCGDYISVDTVLADIPAALDEENKLYLYSPDSEILTFSPERSYCHKSIDGENPSGEWNTMEIYTYGGKSVHIVNGKVNMRLANSRHILNGEELALTRGKIQLQSEGAEIFYRDIKIKTIEEIPPELWMVEKK